jgi:hypothetical protein
MKCYIARILQLEKGTLDIILIIFNIMYKELTNTYIIICLRMNLKRQNPFGYFILVNLKREKKRCTTSQITTLLLTLESRYQRVLQAAFHSFSRLCQT